MRTADIIVGKRYATRYMGVVEVLETGLPRQWGKQKDAIRVRYADGRESFSGRLVSRDLQYEWTEAHVDAERERKREREALKASVLRAELLVESLGLEATVSGRSLAFKDAHALADFLEGLDA